MCGIVAAAGSSDISQKLLAGLKRLEYRGYDSAGIALINDGHLEIKKAVGKVAILAEAAKNLQGNIGIAHTRWATHGRPSIANAHPHVSHHSLAVVHNGIIENYMALRAELSAAGYDFVSETDTEVIAHLIHRERLQGHALPDAVKAAVAQLQGSFSIAVLDLSQPNQIVAMRQASPLVIGLGLGENFLASDQLALLNETRKFIDLKEGELAEITVDAVKITDATGNIVEPNIYLSVVENAAVELGNYSHFMLKEIFEQPSAIKKTLEDHIDGNKILSESLGIEAVTILSKVQQIQIVACGTSYHAGLVAKYYLEAYAKLPCAVEIASEFRYRETVTPPNTLFITISQSGETADTLAALQKAKSSSYLASLSICNVSESALTRESDFSFITRAGPEIGVASTKAFTTQLTALIFLTGVLAKLHKHLESEENFLNQLHELPKLAEKFLALNSSIAELAKTVVNKKSCLFLGRGSLYPIALEGALKLKEISYIHAEAYPAGELKHGPLALIDSELPVIALVAQNAFVDKVQANLQEVQARGGNLLIFADERVELDNLANAKCLKLPAASELQTPILHTLPLQLFAYHVALLKGANIDQPRNLAKSVTVE